MPVSYSKDSNASIKSPSSARQTELPAVSTCHARVLPGFVHGTPSAMGKEVQRELPPVESAFFSLMGCCWFQPQEAEWGTLLDHRVSAALGLLPRTPAASECRESALHPVNSPGSGAGHPWKH